MPDPFPPVADRLRDGRDDAVARWCDLLRIPSVSADPARDADVDAAAGWVAAALKDAGCTVETVATGGHPIVFGRSPEVAGAPTVLVYGHYDVQPPDPLDRWTTPPFEPTVRDGKMYARGATDDKGQMLTHLVAAKAWADTHGNPPVNLRFVIEGEEEVGSNHLDGFLEGRRADLACDVAVISDTSQYAPGIPAITYGLRGIVACEFTVHGPKKDLHSGVFGGSVANPANVLAALVAGLHDEDGRVTVRGFYDDVVELTPAERDEFAALPFDQPRYLASIGSPAVHGESGYSTHERRWARPTCDVNGLFSGYTGVGPKTIVPASATAKLSCRLVPDQDPAKITGALERHLRMACPVGARLEFKSFHGAPGIAFDTGSAHFAAAKKAVEYGFDAEPVLIREGGSIPVVGSLRRILGVETLLLGWGQNTDDLHSPDEHFSVDAFHRGALASARLMHELAADAAA